MIIYQTLEIMKTYILLLGMILGFISCKKTENISSQKESSNKIVFGQIDSLYSKILEESRKVWVHTPTNAGDGNKYPVLYLLDGPGHFYSVSGMIKQLSTTNGNTILPEMIIVAIPNTNRSRDLTPSEVDIDFFTGDSIQYASGGGDLFLDFIEKELIPYIDQSYPTAPYRTYVGHSFGGLSVINALITKSHIFNNYIAIDPSLWWDNQAFLNYADSILTVKNFDKKALFVGIANTMSEGMEINTVKNDTSKTTEHIRSILKFVNTVKDKSNGLLFDWKYYEDDNHGSVPLITEYDAFRFLFSWHQFRGGNDLYDPSSSLTLAEAVKLVTLHYENVSTKMGYEVLPPESLMNGLGYYFMRNDMMEKAVAFFDLNIQNYPNSSNVYDSRGDCFLAQGDTVKALDYFRKALEVGDNDFSQEKIDRLSKTLEIKN